MRLLIYISVFLIFSLLVFWGFYLRLIRPIQNRKLRTSMRILMLLCLAILIVPPWVYRVYPDFHQASVRLPIMYLHFFVMGLTSFLMVYLFFASGLEKLFFFVQKIYQQKRDPKSSTAMNLERRLFLAHSVNAGVLALAGASSIIGRKQAFATPSVFDVTIPLHNLAPDLHDFSIVQISDLHIGPLLGGEFLRTVVDKVNLLRPSLVAITGDLVDGKTSQLAQEVLAINDLRSDYGTYFVSGNHEYYSGHDEWMALLKKMGLKVLENNNEMLKIGNSNVLIGGVPDLRTSPIKSDPHLAISHPQGKADLAVLLAHQPSSCFEAVKAGFNLQLSGHTHGGQFHPWTWVVKLIHPYIKGLNFGQKNQG